MTTRLVPAVLVLVLGVSCAGGVDISPTGFCSTIRELECITTDEAQANCVAFQEETRTNLTSEACERAYDAYLTCLVDQLDGTNCEALICTVEEVALETACAG